MDFKIWLNETQTDTFQMYHGGKRWEATPSAIIGSKKGRYEYGVGIYLTNNYSTARKYASGSRVVHIIDIDRNFKKIGDVQIPLKTAIDFLKTNRIKNKNKIIQDLISNAERMKRDTVGADIINNLVVNYESGAGEAGVAITNFLTSFGVDASLERVSGDEFYLVVFNPKIIKNVSIVDPKNIPSFMLPINQ